MSVAGGRELNLKLGKKVSVAVEGGKAPYTYQLVSGKSSITPDGEFTPASSGSNLIRVADNEQNRLDFTINVKQPTAYVVAQGEIDMYRVDTDTGGIAPLDVPRISYGAGARQIVFHPSGEFAYVPCPWGSDTIMQYSVDSVTGALSPLSPASFAQATGSVPLAMAIHPNGGSAYVANYSANSISQYLIDPQTGLLSAHSTASIATGSTQAEGVALNASGTLLFASNYAGKMSLYGVDSAQAGLSPLSPATFTTGGGPVTGVFSKAMNFFYIPNNGVSRITMTQVDPTTGIPSLLSPAQISLSGQPNALILHPNKEFAYAGLANGSIEMLAVNPVSGQLTLLTPSVIASGFSTINSIALDPTGNFLFAVHYTESRITGYRVDQVTGQLTQLPELTQVTGPNPQGVYITP